MATASALDSTQNNPRKRKTAPVSHPGPLNKRRNAKVFDARTIATQSSGQAFKNGEVDLSKFVKAREFEINALEQGLRRSRSALSSRAFQNVPRELRRRTASHDAKRVPKRLRSRARKEMLEDNTPTGKDRKKSKTSKAWLRMDGMRFLRQHAKDEQRKRSLAMAKRTKVNVKDGSDAQAANGATSGQDGSIEAVTEDPTPSKPPMRNRHGVLQKAATPKARFRKRQIHKAWLPTHLYHAKRAHMTPPKEPLWRMAIPLSPTEKSYRPTHRASHALGAIAWDVSYMSTIGLEGREESLVGLLKSLGVGQDEQKSFWSRQARRWMTGTRSWSGWLYGRDSAAKTAIAEATIIWCATDKESEMLVDEVDAGATTTGSRASRRRVFIRVHPSAFLQVWEETLKVAKMQKPAVAVEDLRFEIGSIEVTGQAAFECITATCWPCGQGENPAGDALTKDWKSLRDIQNINTLPPNALIYFNMSDARLHYPPRKENRATNEIPEERLAHLLVQWPFDHKPQTCDLFDRSRRQTACKRLPSQKAINRRKALAAPGEYPQPSDRDPQIPVLIVAGRGRSQGRLTILLPWKCVLPTWYVLMHQPLSTGGNPRLGGLEQIRQIAFEREEAWFPADLPGTQAGMTWELREREKRKREWERKPKSKRIAWESVKIGPSQRGEVGLGWACDWGRLVTGSSEGERYRLRQLTAAEARSLLAGTQVEAGDQRLVGALSCVRLTLTQGGVPRVCARVYRLPATDSDLRRQWLKLLTSSSAMSGKAWMEEKPREDAPAHIQRRYLAAQLLGGPVAPRIGDARYPHVPGEEDLIGFVTTGNFNLASGQGRGIASILLERVLSGRHAASGEADERICVVRDVGQSIGRLARWEVVAE